MVNPLELLKEQLKYSGLEELPSDMILNAEISAARGEINRRRNFKPHGDTFVAPGYERFVVPMAMSVVLKTGARGQDSHTENGIGRGYVTDGEYPRDLLRQITWVAR